jgi:hypothetical protein
MINISSVCETLMLTYLATSSHRFDELVVIVTISISIDMAEMII